MVKVEAMSEGVYSGRHYAPGDTFYVNEGALDTWMKTVPDEDKNKDETT